MMLLAARSCICTSFILCDMGESFCICTSFILCDMGESFCVVKPIRYFFDINFW